MKPSFKIMFCLLLVIMCSWTGMALATRYLNLVDGTEKWFVAENSANPYDQAPRMHTVVSSQPGGVFKMRREILAGDRVLTREDRWFDYDAEGNIYFLGTLPGPDTAHPILWVDAPLEVGKTWKDSRPADEWSDTDNRIRYEFTVLEMREISCPEGIFDCYQVFQTEIHPDGQVTRCTFWYNEQCGLVRCCLEDNVHFRLRKVIMGDPTGPDEEMHEEMLQSELLGGVLGVPNPANPMTAIRFELKEPARVEAAVYDLSGRLVRCLIAGEYRSAGPVSVTWQGADDRGNTVASGTYVVRVMAAGEVNTTRVSLVR